jgi:hypothetical protein
VTNVPTPAPLVAIDLCFERLGKVRVLNLDERKEEDIVAADWENKHSDLGRSTRPFKRSDAKLPHRP